MIALIRKDEGGVYATNILAILQKGRNRQVVAFTEDYCHVKRFPVWKMKRNVYVLGGDFPEDKCGDWCGYKSVIEDEELLKAVKKHPENIDRLDGDLCSLAHPPAIMEWHDIGCLKDTYYLTSLSSNFFAAKILRCSHE
ncbi:MAG: hypothetical protein LUD47_00390 [Clostridia bacterium]|nr:hypothetical protein [Clostridia bacterium]